LQKDTQNKRKKLKSFDWRKKNKGKIKRYILLKCKTIKTLLFEQDETNRRGRAKPLHASLKNSLLFLQSSLHFVLEPPPHTRKEKTLNS
jgi:rRNA pseudouridine-1189 N-methylase Emg1 (Nep1/Mra1 family)